MSRLRRRSAQVVSFAVAAIAATVLASGPASAATNTEAETTWTGVASIVTEPVDGGLTWTLDAYSTTCEDVVARYPLAATLQGCSTHLHLTLVGAYGTCTGAGTGYLTITHPGVGSIPILAAGAVAEGNGTFALEGATVSVPPTTHMGGGSITVACVPLIEGGQGQWDGTAHYLHTTAP